MKRSIEQSESGKLTHSEKLNNSRPSVALEGPVCAGKSTLLGTLSGYGFSGINEYSEYVSSTRKDFPIFPPNSPDVSEASFQFFLELERQRFQSMSDQIVSGPTILDRSIHTLLAFEVGAKQLTGIDILPWATKFVSNHPENIIWPNHIVYLDLAPDESLLRAKKENHKTADFLFDSGFNQGFCSYFLKLKELYPSCVTFIDASNSREQVVQDVLGLLF